MEEKLLQKKLTELGQKTPSLLAIQAKGIINYILLAIIITAIGFIGTSLIGRALKLSCQQAEGNPFGCEMSLSEACPEMRSCLGFVDEALAASNDPKERLNRNPIVVGQARVEGIFVVIGFLIVVWGLTRATHNKGYIP